MNKDDLYSALYTLSILGVIIGTVLVVFPFFWKPAGVVLLCISGIVFALLERIKNKNIVDVEVIK